MISKELTEGGVQRDRIGTLVVDDKVGEILLEVE
jgi:hypothetical protein